MSIKQNIYNIFQTESLNGKTLADLCKLLNIPYREKNRLLPILNQLLEEGKLFKNESGKYFLPESLGLIEGTICGNERGFAFLTPTDKNTYPNDFFIPKRALKGALHGDSVLAVKIENSRGHSDEATVVKILQRGFQTIVGTFQKDKKNGYLIPDEKRYSQEIFIPLSTCYKIKNGVKAVAKITAYPVGKRPSGEIIEVLGDEDDFFAEELSIIRSYQLKEAFPDKVLAQAEKQKNLGITEWDIQKRLDLRNLLTFTIDGEDTRDIDDAISLEKVGSFYHLGVHIADVSHYVPYRSVLDKEAYERGTSVYFPDRVLPMLPKALSNGICSLNEGEDRLTLSCLMTIDEKGNVTDSKIVESIIRSKRKMTYTQVTQILEKNKDALRVFEQEKDVIFLCEELTRILQNKRAKKGGITLDVKEAKILFNPTTYQITIPDYDRAFSYQIIEAFMVLANETVATYMHSIDAPFIYRIHEKPAEDKAVTFRAFAQTLGLTPRFNAQDVKPYDYQNLLNSAKNSPVYSVLNRVMLRSMQKARYAPDNVGHFGLASDCYCHFTSPIRRYPDLCIHRIIKEILKGDYEETKRRYNEFVAQASTQSSNKERLATDAERDVDDLYKTMYMSDKLGEEYDGIISGVTSFGLFVELPNTIEGFIPIESLYGNYQFIEKQFTLKGSSKSYTIGDSVHVKVLDVDFYRRRTEFRLLDDKNTQAGM